MDDDPLWLLSDLLQDEPFEAVDSLWDTLHDPINFLPMPTFLSRPSLLATPGPTPPSTRSLPLPGFRVSSSAHAHALIDSEALRARHSSSASSLRRPAPSSATTSHASSLHLHAHTHSIRNRHISHQLHTSTTTNAVTSSSSASPASVHRSTSQSSQPSHTLPPLSSASQRSRSGPRPTLPPLRQNHSALPSPWSRGSSGASSLSALAPPSPRHEPLPRPSTVTVNSDDLLASYSLAADFSSPSSYAPAHSYEPSFVPTNPAEAAATTHPSTTNPRIKRDREISSTPGLPPSPTDVVMPVTTRKRAVAGSTTHESAISTPKRRRTSAAGSHSRNRPTPGRSSTSGAIEPLKGLGANDEDDDDDDDLFGDNEKSKNDDDDEVEVIDLADTDEVPDHLKHPKVDNRVKLSAFQCVICMDDANGLTVTHCGHLFCHQCLHSSLNIDAMKNKCPICRQKIETRSREHYGVKTKGFWPLELKLMTARRKGKQAAPRPQ